MATNYGIGFCKKVLSTLNAKENKIFKEKGHGFDCWGPEFQAELKYKRLLKKFERERDLGLSPSYNPDIHGCLEE